MATFRERHIDPGPPLYADIGNATRVDVSPPDPNDPPQDTHDGYPAVIADAHTAFGCTTVEEVEDYWLATLERKNVPPWTGDPLDEVVPYINRARWLIDCPGCNAGNFVWDRMPLACCLDCGLMAKVSWQSPFIRSAAVRLLAVRPILNCNWNAHQGETVEELERENRWLLNEPSVEKNGLIVPAGLDVPDALAKYDLRVG